MTFTDVLLIGGRSGVGKSSVAFACSRLLAQADIRHAVIEGDNLDQAYPAPWREGIDLAEQNLATIWRNYWAHGYRRLLFTNTVSVLQVPTLTAALGGPVRAHPVLLTASDDTAAERLGRRESGASLREHLDRSRDAARLLDAEADPGVLRVDTDARTATEVAWEILGRVGWSDAPRECHPGRIGL